LNLTADRAAAPGFATIYPCGGAVPTASNLNFTPGKASANSAIVKVGEGGRVCLWSSVRADLIVDVSGFTEGDAAYAAVDPIRVEDTRNGNEATCGLAVRTVDPTTIDLIDLNTGAVIRRVSSLPFGSDTHGRLVRDCKTVLAIGYGNDHWIWYAIDIATGKASRLPDPNVGYSALTDSLALAVSAYADRIVDLTIDPSPWAVGTIPLPEAPAGSVPHPWSIIAATPDKSLIVVTIGDESYHGRLYYLDHVGNVIGTWDPPANSRHFKLSPTGRYIAYVDGGPRDLHVVTLDGTEVAQLPNQYLLHPVSWLSDGALAVCDVLSKPPLATTDAKVEAKRWDLFSAPKPLAKSGASMPCVDDAA
jgi:hypothetical protein